MSVEKKLLERWVKIIVFPEYYPLREETATFLAQPEQGGYDEATIKDEEIRKLEEQVARSEFTAALARINREGNSMNEVGCIPRNNSLSNDCKYANFVYKPEGQNNDN